MAGEIINRVSNSQLITIDLTDYAPNLSVKELDIKDFLFQGIVLKEKEFRLSLKEFDFSNYANKTVALNCSADAIVPMWAFMLVTSYLNSINADIHFGGKEDVFQQIFTTNIDTINSTEFENKKVINGNKSFRQTLHSKDLCPRNHPNENGHRIISKYLINHIDCVNIIA